MPIKACHTLNSSQKEQIHSLEDRCRKESPLTLTFPTEDFDHCLLYYGEDGALLAAAAFTAAFTPEAPDAFECSALTDPAHRNRGLFSALLKKGLQLIPEESDILFYSDGSCEDTKKALDALEAELLGCDYMMELRDLTAAVRRPDGPAPITPSDISRDEDGCLKLLFRTDTGEALVSCARSYYYFFSFEILENFRGMGHGEALLRDILTYLYLKDPMPVRLQVSGSNLPAVSLYKKTGFRITDTLSTYLY